MTTRPPWRTSSTLSASCTGMRTTGSPSAGMGGGGGGSGSGSSLGGRLCAWASENERSAATSTPRITSILLEVEQHLALGRRGCEAALLIEREDRIDHLLRLVVDLHQVEIVRVDHALGGQALAHPRHQPAPIRLVHEDDRHLAGLAGLHERERFEELVQRAVATRQNDERGGDLREHRLARKEVAKAQADVLIAARRLLARQVDVQAD